ncbi:MAG: tetratricopeptide repeat protein, partial [Myxococcota bacterium]
AEDAVRILEEGRDESPLQIGILLAEHYVDIEDPSAALVAFDSAFMAESDDELMGLLKEEHRFMLGDILIMAHQENRLRKLLPFVEEPAYRDFLEARMLQEKGEHRRALEAFDRGLRLWPGSEGARYLAGLSAIQLGEFDTAVDHFRAALRGDASLSDAGLELARLYSSLGKHSAATHALKRHLKGHPSDADAVRMIADLNLLMGSRSASADARSRLTKMPGWRDKAFADQARDLARHVSPRQAFDFIEANVPDLLDPEFEETLAIWCELMRVSHRVDEALVILSSETESGRSGQAYRDALRGQLLGSEGRFDEAAVAFTIALETDPDEWRAAIGKARLFAQGGQAEEAVLLFDRVSRLVEDDPIALYESGLLFANEPDVDRSEARRRLKEALKRQPTYGLAAFALAQMALAQGDSSDEAIEFARRAARLLRSVDSTLVAAKIQLARGEAREAIAAIEWALEFGGEGGVVRHLHAQALLKAGDKEGARKSLELSLVHEPFAGSVEARNEWLRLGGASRVQAGSG